MDTGLFLEQFGHLADSPGGVQKLRNLILELAVRGRLVEQRPDDEPARELLKRIEAEKRRLVKAGEIGKSSPLPSIGENERPYELPDGWEWVRLSEIVSFSIGRTPARKEISYWQPESVAWVSIADLNHTSYVRETKEKVSEKAVREVFREPPSPVGTILMSFKLTIGKLSRLAIPAYHNEAIVSIYPFLEKLDNFIFTAIQGINLQEEKSNAIKGNTLNSTSLSRIKFPLPPLAEQERIVAKVDELMGLCDQLEAEQAKRDRLRDTAAKSTLFHVTSAASKAEARQYWGYAEGHFAELFDRVGTVGELRAMILQLAVQGRLVAQRPDDEPARELLKRIEAEKRRLVKAGEIKGLDATLPVDENEYPYPIPFNWEWSRLKNIGEINPRNNLPDDLPISFVPMASISEQYGIQPEIEERLWGDVRKGYTHFAEKDVALAKITPCFQNGKACVMKSLVNGFGAGTTELHIFRDLTRNIYPEYVYIFVKSPFFVQQGIALMTGTAGQQRVPKDYFASTPFPLPPLAEQERIVARVDELMGLCDQLAGEAEHSHSLAGRLFDSIVYHLFEPA